MKKLLIILFLLPIFAFAQTKLKINQLDTSSSGAATNAKLQTYLTQASAGTNYSPKAGSSSITTVGTLAAGSIPYSLLTGTPTVPTAANPTASAGTTAVNGVASTYMRSDGAPKVDSSAFRTVANSQSLAQTQTALNLKANLASPTFTGTPTVPSLTISGNASPTYSQGRLFYDTGSESLTFYNNDSNIGLQIGQEEWIQVRNATGSTIVNGSAVYINGSSSGVPTVALAQANAGTTTVCAGLTTEDIANGATGYVTTIGVVHGLNTNSFSVGAVYLDATTPGALTQTPPTAPNYRYRIGFVTVVNATTGAIHVTPSTAALGNGTANQVFGMNNAGSAQEVKSIVGSSATGLTITNTANTITGSIDTTKAQTVLNFFPKGDTRYLTQTNASTTYAPLASPTFTGTVTAPVYVGSGSQPFVSSGTATSSDWVAMGTGGAAQTLAQLMYDGATSTRSRVYERGASGVTLAAADSYTGHAIGEQAVTTASSGTSAIIASLAVRGANLTVTGGSTVTDYAALYSQVGTSGATGTWNIWGKYGVSRFSGLRTDSVSSLAPGVTIGAGTTALAPLKLTSGTDLTSAAAGNFEYNGTRLAFSPSTTRKRIALFTDAAPSSGQVMIGNGTDFTLAQITTGAATGMTTTAGSGSITLNVNWTSQTASDANLTVTNSFSVVKLVAITAGRTVTLPTAATGSGKMIYIWNQSTTQSFLWTFATTVKDKAGNTITAIPVTGWQLLYSDGTNWNLAYTDRTAPIISSAGTLTLTYAADYVATGTTTTWTLPAISSTINGFSNQITIKNKGSGNITLNSNAGGNDIYSSSAVSTITIAAGNAVTLIPNGTTFDVH